MFYQQDIYTAVFMLVCDMCKYHQITES